MGEPGRRPQREVQGHVYRLGEEPIDDLSSSTTPEERLAMVWELTIRAWTLTGRSFPSYDRRSMPIVVRRPA